MHQLLVGSAGKMNSYIKTEVIFCSWILASCFLKLKQAKSFPCAIMRYSIVSGALFAGGVSAQAAAYGQCKFPLCV
jgi:hypothetical protein